MIEGQLYIEDMKIFPAIYGIDASGGYFGSRLMKEIREELGLYI